MNLKIHVENKGQIVLRDRNYLESGGEAAVYKKDKTAYKIYHDPAKMIPLGKIKELNQIQATNILKPKNVIRDSRNKPIGYTMTFVNKSHPMCKLFTKSFKDTNRITESDIVYLIKKMQLSVSGIHTDNCLIVDLNEMNLLSSLDFKIPYFIDVDSYQTPSFKATAIMDSIRDRQVNNNQFTVQSDWFSFAVIIFQMYIGIHPYKGKHPKYKSSQWAQRMDNGVSVFDKNVTLPRICNDFSVIPNAHLAWLKDVFVNGNRGIPPLPDAIIPVQVPHVFVAFKTIESNESFKIELVEELHDKIISVQDVMGSLYYRTLDKIYRGKKVVMNDIKSDNVQMCVSNTMSLIVSELTNGLLKFFDISGRKREISVSAADNAMSRNNCIYSISMGRLTEHSFVKFSDNKIVTKSKFASLVSELSTKMFDGLLIQDLLGKIHVTIPYEQGKCKTQYIPELDGFRILEGKSEQNICGIIAEKSGTYYRFVIIWLKNFSEYIIRRTDDVNYGPVNLTVLPNGVCIMAIDSGDVEVFKTNNVKLLHNSPFDPGMKLFNVVGKVHFIDRCKVYSVTMKK